MEIWIALAICGGIALSVTVHTIWKARFSACQSDLKAANKHINDLRNEMLGMSAELSECKKSRKETAEQLLNTAR